MKTNSIKNSASSNPAKEAHIPVCIRDEEAIRDTIVLQDFDGLSVRIHRSLLPDNHIEICEKEFALIPESLYDAWFGREWKELKEKEQRWEWYYYKTHIGFFWQHRKQIWAEQRYFHVPTPVKLIYRLAGFSIDSLSGRRILLGVLLRAWEEYPEIYTRPCKKCGGMMMLYSFNGSPMSGSSSKSHCCVDCGLRIEYERGSDFDALRQPIVELTASLAGEQPSAQPSSMVQLVSELTTGEK